MGSTETPPVPEKKKSKVWIWLGGIVALIVLLAVCVSVLPDADSPTPSPASVPSPPAGEPEEESPQPDAPERAEEMLQRFEGTGKHTTRPFTVPDRWEVRYNMGGDSNNILYLYTAEGDPAELIENDIGPREGTKFIPQGGDYYLEMDSGGSWVVEVWQLA